MAFPADVLHEVTEVRGGTRDTVVDWFYDGGPFRLTTFALRGYGGQEGGSHGWLQNRCRPLVPASGPFALP